MSLLDLALLILKVFVYIALAHDLLLLPHNCLIHFVTVEKHAFTEWCRLKLIMLSILQELGNWPKPWLFVVRIRVWRVYKQGRLNCFVTRVDTRGQYWHSRLLTRWVSPMLLIPCRPERNQSLWWNTVEPNPEVDADGTQRLKLQNKFL